MADISSWSPVDASNNAAPPNGWPENMLPSAINDSARAMMGAIRRNYDQTISGSLSLPYLPYAGGNATAAGTLAASYVHSTGDILANNTLTAFQVTSTGHISAAGNATVGGTITATGNITSTNYVNAGGFSCDSIQVINTSSISTPGGPVTVPTYCNETGNGGLQLYSLGSRYLSDTHVFFNVAGSASAPISASAFNVVSDQRLKTDIEPSGQGLPEVLRLNPVSFRRLHAAGRETGFIAQDVEAALPHAVTNLDLDGEPTLAISDMPILAAVVNAIKNLSARLDRLEDR